jgi:tetratricopeptide (TPR) repeat protein
MRFSDCGLQAILSNPQSAIRNAAGGSATVAARVIFGRMTPSRIDEDWIGGRASLGAASGWTAEEMRLVADVGYALAEQGRNEEAIRVFEGLSAIAPATGYFQSALGALRLREGDPSGALGNLEAALNADPSDVAALINRGEARMQLGETAAALTDLRAVANVANAAPGTTEAMCVTRARALLRALEEGQYRER